MLRLRLEHDSACTITEEHTCRAVRPIQYPGERFRADDESPPRLPGFQKIVRNRQTVDEARTDGLHIEGCALRDAELGLYSHRRSRKGAIGRCRRANDE